MDRMDEIWKDRFNGEELSNQDFLIPDEIVWSNIADATVRKNNRKRVLFWLFTGILGTLILLSFIYQNTVFASHSTDENKAQVEVTNKVVDIHSSTDSGVQITDIEIEQDRKDNKSIEKKGLTTEIKATPKTKLKHPAVSNEPVQSSIFIRKKEKGTFNVNDVENNFFVEKEINNAVSVLVQSENEESPKTVSLKALDIFYPSRLKDPVADFPVELNLPLSTQPISKNPSWSVSAQAGATYWKHQISSQYTSDLSAFDFNYSDNFGWLTGINVSRKIGSHFTVDAGLSYEQVEVKSGHNSTLNYNPAAETTTASNAYSLSLATPYGLIPAQFEFDRKTSIGNTSVDLLVDVFSEHTIRNFSIPLTVKYNPFGNKARFQPSIGVGLGANYLATLDNQLAHIDTHHTAIEFNKESSSFDTPEIQNWHLDYRLVVETSMILQNHFSLNMSYAFISGINPLFKQQNYQTKINRHQLTVGLRKSF